MICEKCGKPLVIKWGKHGSFIACTGYPEFSSKSIESDLEKVQKDIEVAAARAQEDRISAAKLRQVSRWRSLGQGGEFIVTPLLHASSRSKPR